RLHSEAATLLPVLRRFSTRLTKASFDAFILLRQKTLLKVYELLCRCSQWRKINLTRHRTPNPYSLRYPATIQEPFGLLVNGIRIGPQVRRYIRRPRPARCSSTLYKDLAEYFGRVELDNY